MHKFIPEKTGLQLHPQYKKQTNTHTKENIATYTFTNICKEMHTREYNKKCENAHDKSKTQPQCMIVQDGNAYYKNMTRSAHNDPRVFDILSFVIFCGHQITWCFLAAI